MKKNLKVKDALPGLGARLFMRLGAFAARMLFNRKLNIHLENWDLLENMKPPFILVANHVSNYDPAIIAANQKHFIHWVANDAVFRSSFMRLIFRWIQVIPKTKGMSDLDTVRNMHRKIRQGGVVGLFPEGQTSWDGLTQPLMPATPKLLKLFKVPVVAVVNKGGYMSHPRWSWQLRRGRMILEARLVLDGEGIKTAGVGEITARLEKALAHDDFEFCRRNPFPLKSEKRAEKLELFIYVCPSCRKLESLVSRGNDMVCSCCGWTVHVDEYGQFSRDEALPFSHNLEAWGRWQRVVAEEIILSGLEAPEREGQVLLRKGEVSLFTGEGLSPLTFLASGELRLYSNRIELEDGRKKGITFFLASLDALSLFKRQNLEFYHEKIFYRLHFTRPGDSAWIWQEFLEVLLFHCRRAKQQNY